MSIINERTKDDTKECEGFREQLRVRSEELAEQILHAHFGYLTTWIPEAERKLEKGLYDYSSFFFINPERGGPWKESSY